MAFSRSCDSPGCERCARWAPVLFAPLRPTAARSGPGSVEELFALWLGIRTCRAHRLPRQGWTVLSMPAVRQALLGVVEPLELALEDAWIENLPLSALRDGLGDGALLGATLHGAWREGE